MSKKEEMSKEELLTNILSNVHKSENNEQKQDDTDKYKALELAKIITKEFLDIINVKTLSNINSGQKQNLVKLKVLNTFYKSNAITEYCEEFLVLSRSENALGIKALTKIISNNVNNEESEKSRIWDKILRRS